MRRVAVTGLGVVCPLGVGSATVWSRLLEGKSGVVALPEPLNQSACKIGAPVPEGETAQGNYCESDYIPAREARRMDGFIRYGIVAAAEAIADSGYQAETEEQQARSGVYLGSGVGGIQGIADAAYTLRDKGVGKLSPFFMPSVLINLLSGRVSIAHGFRGPNSAVVTACSTGTHAIGDAARIIALDDADVMIAGGAESALVPLGIESFCALRALSTHFNDRPTEASRPWDTDRDGFVMGNGAGVVVLEEWEHASRRGAKIYAEVVGYGMSGDAHHITAPAEGGRSAILAMRSALRHAGISADGLDYINAHATSTPLGDIAELSALREVLGAALGQVSVSSTKSQIGHLLGAAGAVEAVFSILALKHQVAPATLNLHSPDPAAEGFDLVPHQPKERTIGHALSNSFGFGGTNASLIFRAV